MKSPKNKKEQRKSTVRPWNPLEPGEKAEASFSDQRNEAIVQGKLREGMADRPHKEETAQLKDAMQSPSRKQSAPIQQKANHTGLPTQLKSGIENLSGYAMDDVKVHYNSDKPAQLQAHAYAQGTEIHLAPGQEKHLPHEAWHVVQQKQGRVQSTRQLKSNPSTGLGTSGVNINDDAGLEKEADVMGAKALQDVGGKGNMSPNPVQRVATSDIVQREADEDYWVELIQRGIDDFCARLDELILKSQEEHGTNAFRLIKVEELLEGADPEVRSGFFRFVKGLDPQRGTVVEEMVQNKLKEKFGYDQVQDLKNVLTENLGWDNLEFKTVGTGAFDFMLLAQHSDDYMHMRRKITTHPDPPMLIREVVGSGKSNPVRKQVARGTKFYKLMGPGRDITQTPSPYYLSWAEIQTIMRGTNLADHLGLPLMNYEAVFMVYEIEAQVDTTVFESTIAPTEQKIKSTNAVHTNPGGRQQTLILDNQNQRVWRKNSTPVYILDPEEGELARLVAPHHVADQANDNN